MKEVGLGLGERTSWEAKEHGSGINSSSSPDKVDDVAWSSTPRLALDKLSTFNISSSRAIRSTRLSTCFQIFRLASNSHWPGSRKGLQILALQSCDALHECPLDMLKAPMLPHT